MNFNFERYPSVEQNLTCSEPYDGDFPSWRELVNEESLALITRAEFDYELHHLSLEADSGLALADAQYSEVGNSNGVGPIRLRRYEIS